MLKRLVHGFVGSGNAREYHSKPLWELLGPPGRLQRPLGRVLGLPGRLVESFRDRPDGSWDGLGAFRTALEASWDGLEASRTALEASWGAVQDRPDRQASKTTF